jgi:hypothetical protein
MTFDQVFGLTTSLLVARLAPAPAAAEQPESARLEVSESSTSLTGESHSDTTDADASVLDPTFTSCLVNP